MPAPFMPEISDPEKVKSTYQYWRVRIFYSMFIGFAFYYFTRKSFTFVMPILSQDLGLTKADVGLLSSILYLSYGVSKFASGILSDRSNPRYFMAAGLFMTGLFNIFFGFSSSFFLLAVFWGLNGWFQGFGVPPCAKFLTHWYSQNERGAWWSSWSVSQNVGACIIPWVVSLSVYFFDWRAAMYVPGVLCILVSIFLVNRLRDSPQSLGLPPIEQFRDDYAGVKPKDDGSSKSTVREILLGSVLNNKFIWILSFAYFFVYVVRIGINDWTATFLYEEKGYSLIGATGFASIFELGGFFGGLCAGWISDKAFSARRGPVNVLYSLGMLAATLLFWSIPEGYPWLDTAAIFTIGFMVFGPQMLIGVAAAEMVHKKAAATSNGFAGCFAYMGAAMAGGPLGWISHTYGWEGYFWTLAGCGLASALLLVPLWNVRSNTQPVPVKSDQPILTPAEGQ